MGEVPGIPDGIPDEILHGENDHSTPLPGQSNDFIYQPGRENSYD